jgi:hypothetical protein
VNEWLLFNANSAIFQLYHGDKKRKKNKYLLNTNKMKSKKYHTFLNTKAKSWKETNSIPLIHKYMSLTVSLLSKILHPYTLTWLVVVFRMLYNVKQISSFYKCTQFASKNSLYLGTGWETLAIRRKNRKLTIFYKIHREIATLSAR